MCKIVVITNMSKIKSQKSAIRKIAVELGELEQDGFGYVAQGENGVFGERTLTPSEFISGFEKTILDLPFLDLDANTFGKFSKITGAGIFHGRTSTNEGTLLNTHPIVKHGWSLVHNGVVTNKGPKHDMITTNDTEHLVHYMAHGGIDALAKNLSGYYAAAAFDPEGALHIFRDDRATLYFARIEAIDSFIIATTKDLIIDIAEELKLTISSMITPMKANQYVVFKNNILVDHREFEPLGATAVENKWAGHSLGEELDSNGYFSKGYPAPTAKNNAWERDSLGEFDYVSKMSEPEWTDVELQFFMEVETMDHSYEVHDYRDNKITVQEFLSLSGEEQLACTVIRPDGTVMDPENGQPDRLYMGKVS